MAGQTEQRNPVEVLGEEFLERYRQGQKPTVAEYAAAHPELAEEINALFPTILAVERLKCGLQLSSGRPVDSQIEGLEQLGDYRIIREIGRGGMGIVYEAEQQSLGRTVAVKIFPRHVLGDSRRLKRFHREARTAARLHHTNIVPVFGVGRQGGLHYYVMQLIQGIALDDVLTAIRSRQESSSQPPSEPAENAEPPGTPEQSFSSAKAAELLLGDATRSGPPLAEPPRSLLELRKGKPRSGDKYWRNVASIGFQVADALSYAHAQEILHRDIKPGNLLLDARGAVWITDFGLAKVAAQEKLSNPGDVVGTLRYMAPEVLSGEHDPRSDIYSLGLTLYELLTLRPAFEETSSAQLIQDISRGGPRSPRSVRPEIPRDLEAIVLKATARQPSRRYQTAAQLADDLRCYLEGRPVQARRLSPVEQIGRWARRNPAIAALSILLMLVVLASFAAISEQWRQAVLEHRRAETNLSLALDSMEHVLDRFASSWMSHPAIPEGEDQGAAIEFRIVPSAQSAVVLQEALQFYDQFAKQNATNPRLQLDTAKAHLRVGDIHERLGQYEQAEAAFSSALQTLQAYAGQPPREESLAIEMAATRNQLGLLMLKTGRLDAAEDQFRRAKALLIENLPRQSPGCRYELARTNNNLGNVLWSLRRPRTARDSHKEAMTLLQELVDEYPDEAAYRLALARAYRGYLPFAGQGDDDTDPVEIRAAGICLLEDLVAGFPNVPDYQCELSEMLTTTHRFGRSEPEQQAASSFVRAAELARQLVQDHPTIPRYRAVLADALRRQANLLQRTNPAEADPRYVEAAQIYRELAQEFPGIQSYELYLAIALREHGETLRSLNRLPEARAALEEAIARYRPYWEKGPQDYFGQTIMARFYDELASLHEAMGDQTAARVARSEARTLRQRSMPRGRSRIPSPQPR